MKMDNSLVEFQNTDTGAWFPGIIVDIREEKFLIEMETKSENIK